MRLSNLILKSCKPSKIAILHMGLPQTGSGAHPASYWMGTGSKVAGAWSWPLTSSSTEVKNVWSYTSTCSIHLHGI